MAQPPPAAPEASTEALLGADDEEAKALLLAMEKYHPIVRSTSRAHGHSHTLLFLVSHRRQKSRLLSSLAQVPDAVSAYFMCLSGYNSTDPRVTRLASLAAHKFAADITNDALRICKARQQGKGRLVLTSEDLAQSARDYGIHIRKPGYFADAPSLGGGHIS